MEPKYIDRNEEAAAAAQHAARAWQKLDRDNDLVTSAEQALADLVWLYSALGLHIQATLWDIQRIWRGNALTPNHDSWRQIIAAGADTSVSEVLASLRTRGKLNRSQPVIRPCTRCGDDRGDRYDDPTTNYPARPMGLCEPCLIALRVCEDCGADLTDTEILRCLMCTI